MKSIGNILVVMFVSYFTIVPPKINRSIETINYSERSIILDEEIKSTIDTIQQTKEKIYTIQKELGIK